MTQQRSKALTSGQVGPKLQGVGLAPTSTIFRVLAAGQNAKNLRMSIHSHCLRLSGFPDIYSFEMISCWYS